MTASFWDWEALENDALFSWTAFDISVQYRPTGIQFSSS